MAITIAAQAQASRPGTFFDLTQDWTWFQQVKNGSTTPAGAFFRLYMNYGDPSATHSYIALRSPAASNNIVLKTFDGSTTSTSAAFSPSASTWYWTGVTYVASTHTLTFYANSATPVGTLSVNLSTFAFVETSSAIGSTVALTSFGDYSVAYSRQWQIALTGAALVLEAASKTPVEMGTLLSDTPIQTAIDLTAHNNTLTQWTATGTISTDTGDPLLTVVAGPPTNTSPATATTLTLNNAYFQDMVSGGAAVPSGWYVVSATVSEFWGGMAFGDLTVYKPSLNVFEGLANANSHTIYQELTGDLNSACQFYVTAGNDYYFEIVRNAAVATAVAKISIIRALSLPVPIGSIMVNDDVLGYICGMDVNTGYPLHFFRVPLNPSGEGGSPLADGTIIMTKTDNSSEAALYDNQFNVVSDLPSLTAPAFTHFDIVSSNLSNTFAVSNLVTIIRLIAASGTIDPTIYDVSASSMAPHAIGLNVDASKIYFVGANFNQAVKTWNLLTNSADSDLFAGDSSQVVPKGPIIVLQDGKIVLPRITNATPNHFVLKIVDAAGTLLHTYDLGPCRTQPDNRIATAIEDPDYVWAWGKQTGSVVGVSFFNKVKISDGSLAVDLRGIVQYEDGRCNSSDAGSTETLVRFGHSESCPFWINRTILFSSNTTTETFPIRRQRRFLLPSSDDNKNMQIPIIKILMRTGIGLKPDSWTPDVTTPLGANPQVRIRLSKDGGETWGPERILSAGLRGRFKDRVVMLQATGNYRNAVLEVTVDAPVDWQFLAALGDPVEGSS